MAHDRFNHSADTKSARLQRVEGSPAWNGAWIGQLREKLKIGTEEAWLTVSPCARSPGGMGSGRGRLVREASLGDIGVSVGLSTTGCS
jgi:hypothetical protein